MSDYFNPFTATRREIEQRMTRLNGEYNKLDLILKSRGPEDKAVFGWPGSEAVYATLDEAVKAVYEEFNHDPDAAYKVEKYYV